MSEKPTYEALAQRVAVLESRLQQLEYYDVFFQSLTDGVFFMMLDKPVEWNHTIDREATLDYIFAHQRITRFNDEMLRQNQVSADTYRGLTPNDFYKDDLSKGRQLWAAFLDQGVWSNVHEIVGIGAQQPLIVEATYKAIYDEQGRFLGHFGVHKDITEQTRNRERLEDAETLSKVVLDSLDANICVLDKEGNIVRTNQAWKDFALANDGNLTEVAEAANYLQVCQVPDAPEPKAQEDKVDAIQAQQGLQAVLRGEQKRFQLQYPCHSKTEQRWFLMNARPLGNAEGGAVVSHIDITSLKNAYDKIHDSEEKMRLVTKALHLAVYQFISDQEEFVAFEFVSAGMEALFEQGGDSIHNLYDLAKHVPQSYQQRFHQSLQQALNHKTPWMLEFPVLLPTSKEEKWLWTKALPLVVEKDQVQWNGLLMDITARKLIDQHLKLQEAMIRNLNDAILVTEAEPISEVGPRILYINPAFTKMTGYELDELIGKTPRILQGEKTSRAALDKMRQAFERWESVEVELINYTKSGEEFWVNISIMPIANEVGWYTHWVSVQKDVTERKRQEEKIKASEIKYKTLFEESPLGVLVIDPKTTKAVEFNEKAAAMLGYTKAEFKELSLLDYVDVSPEEYTQMLADLDQKTIYTVEKAVTKKGGGEGYFFASIKKIVLDQKEFIFSLRLDLTHQKQLEKQQKLFFETSLDLLAMINFEGHFVKLNKAWEKTLGYTIEEMQSRPFVDFLHEDDKERSVNEAASLQYGGSVVAFINRYRHKNGQYVWLEWNAISRPNEKLLYTSARNITAELKAKEELKTSEAKYRALFEDSPEGVLLFDSVTWKPFEFNDIVVEMLGYSREVFQQMSLDQYLVDYPERAQIDLVADEVKKRDSLQLEARMRHCDGTIRTVQVKIKYVELPTQKVFFNLWTDITEQKAAQESIRINEERFRSAIDSSLDAFYILDAYYDDQGEVTDFIFVDMNEVGKQQLDFLGIEVIGQQMCEILPINREQGFFERYKEVFLTGKTLDDEFAISVEGYAPQWLHHTVVRLETGVAITARDVTIRKTAIDKVKVSEERFRSAIESSLDGFYILDTHYDRGGNLSDFIFVDTNKVGFSFINMPPEEIIGKKLCELLPINREQGFFEKYKQVFLTGKTLDEEVFVHDAKLKLSWIHHTVVKLKRGIAITIRDIHQRKAQEEQISVANLRLRAQQKQLEVLLAEISLNEQKFRSLAENIKDVFWVFKDGVIEYVSPAYEGMWQQSVESLYKNNDILLENIHKDDKERIRASYYSEHYRKTGDFNEEFRLTRPDGSICWVAMRTFPVVVTKATFHVVGIAKDITTRKASEEELLQLNLKLAVQNNALITREEELQLTNEELNSNKEILEEALEKLARSESNLKALFESSDQGIVFLDTEFRVISFNRAVNAFHPHLEHTPLKLGETVFDRLFDNPMVADAYHEKLEACLTGKIIMFERQFNYPDFSNLRWVETSMYPVRNHLHHIIGVAIHEKDITAQRHIALRLRKSETRLRGILNNTIQAFFLLDRHKKLLLYNTAATKYAQQVFGKTLKTGEALTSFMSEKDQEAFNAKFEEALKGQRSSNESEIIFLDRSVHWFELNYASVDNLEGDRDMVVFSTLDITARKAAQEREKKLLQEQITYQLEQEALKRSAILEGQEKESHRISRELHDSVGQMLSALSYHLNDLDTMLKDQCTGEVKGSEKIETTTERAKVLLKEVIQEVREISHNLMPKILTDYGLIEALKQLRVDFASAVNIPINLDIFCESDRFDDNIEISIFRITQEAVNNILKYAKASEVNIQLIEHDTNLQLLVEDNGVGFSLTEVRAKSGNGLINMEERARLVNGVLAIDTEINKGTCIMVEVPLGQQFGNE